MSFDVKTVMSVFTTRAKCLFSDQTHTCKVLSLYKLIQVYYLYSEPLDKYHFAAFFPLICTHTPVLSTGCFFFSLHCVPGRLASGLSSGPGASGSRQGEGGWLHLLGDLLEGPHCGLAQFSCLSSKDQPCGRREKKRQYIHSGAAIVIFPCALHQHIVSWVMEHVNTELLVVHGNINRYVPGFPFSFSPLKHFLVLWSLNLLPHTKYSK